jgi:hypothetical protein
MLPPHRRAERQNPVASSVVLRDPTKRVALHAAAGHCCIAGFQSRRCRLRVKSPHYRAAALMSASPSISRPQQHGFNATLCAITGLMHRSNRRDCRTAPAGSAGPPHALAASLLHFQPSLSRLSVVHDSCSSSSVLHGRRDRCAWYDQLDILIEPTEEQLGKVSAGFLANEKIRGFVPQKGKSERHNNQRDKYSRCKKRPANPKTKGAVPVIYGSLATVRGAEVDRGYVPGTTADATATAISAGSRRAVRRRPIVVVLPAILRPLPDIAMHVV